MTSVIAIVGPTAVGKSAVADALAHRLHSVVISADAMQVYRGMDIGTAKMRPEECHAPLLLIDVAEPSVSYSAALYQRAARAELDRLIAEGTVPVVCGGTGLYVRAALDEMSFPAGDASSPSRSRYHELAREEGEGALYALLQTRDPESAAVIHPHNVRRVIRALEMADEGVSYARQKEGFSTPQARYDSSYYGLTCDRARLYDRINLRVDQMIADGLVDEVRHLVDQGFGEDLTARQAIGYKEIIDYLKGRSSLDDAIELIKRRSRRYAKRQLSWFRRDARIQWLDMDALGIEGALEAICEREGC